MQDQGWFADWFNTEYYHMLYENRNDKEASAFIHRICKLIQIPDQAKVADIACGKGRHSRVLAGMGLKVYGYDLSPNSIKYAAQHSSGTEIFTVHDIRNAYAETGFYTAFNLFTSFGYFQSSEEDQLALMHIYNMLQPGGIFIQDYLNGLPLTHKLPEKNYKKCGEIEFFTEKEWISPNIIKRILVKSPKVDKEYMEKVQVYALEDLVGLHTSAGFVVQNTFGSYELEPYSVGESSRIIIISQKPV